MLRFIILVTAVNISFLTSFIVDVSISSTPVDDEVFRLLSIFITYCSVTNLSLKLHFLFLMDFRRMARGSETT